MNPKEALGNEPYVEAIDGNEEFVVKQKSVYSRINLRTIYTWFLSLSETLDASLFAKKDGSTSITGQQTFNSGLKADTVDEKTTNTGVTIDGALIKDGNVTVIDTPTNAHGAINKTYADTLYVPIADDIKNTTISLTSAQFKLINTPIQLIAAPGAGLAIDILSAYIEYTRLTADYVVGDPVDIYSTTSQSLFSFEPTCFTGASGTILGTRPAPTSAYTTITNKAVYINSATNPTTGSGTFKIYITYRIVTV